MPSFTLFWIATYSLGLLLAFANPIIGAYTYLFEYYLRPSLHWWGRDHLPLLRWNLVVSIVLMLAYFARQSSLRALPPMPRGPVKYLALMLVWMVVLSPFAASPRTWDAVDQFWRMLLFPAMAILTVRTPLAFDGFVAVHMFGAGWWGWEAYQDPKRVAGRLANIGSGDTLGDNFAAIHLLTVVPFIAVYFLVHREKWLRVLSTIVAPFVINAFILCNSRGATVGMLGMLSYATLVSKRGHRVRIMGAAIGMLVAVYVLADPQFIERQQTTSRYEQDGSAQQRLASWSGGARLLAAHPLGAGGNGFEELSPIYIPEVVEANGGEKRAPHNTWLLIACDWGIPGLVLMVAFYVSSLKLTREIRRRAPEGGIWYYRALAIELSLVGIIVAGMFSDRLYAEAPYWMGALAVALHRLQSNEMVQTESAPAISPQQAAANVLQRFGVAAPAQAPQ